jgi:hypothetical protein
VGDQIQIDVRRISQHGQDIRTNVRQPLSKAREALNAGGTVEGGDFGITGTAAGVTYPTALQFAYEDLRTHLRMLDGLAEGVESAARTYRAAEEASTVRKV